MFDAAIEAGIAAFLAGEGQRGDAEVYAELETRGVESWLAQRLVLLLPLAFGRVVLPDVTVAETFLDPATEHRLDGEPVFMAASARAGLATLAEVERIGLRSAEVNATLCWRRCERCHCPGRCTRFACSRATRTGL